MLTIYGWVDNTTGYGRGTIALYRAALAAGIDVEFMPLPGLPVILPSDLNTARVVSSPSSNLVLAHCTPPQLWPIPNECTVLLYTMFERTELPTREDQGFGGNWVEQINSRASAVYCPSSFAVSVMRKSGVVVPVEKLEYTMQFDDIPFVERDFSKRRPIRIGVYGDLDERKNPEALCTAVDRSGFKDSIELELKHNGNCSIEHLKEKFPFATFWDGHWPREQLLTWLSSLDLFVWLSRGEGLSLPPMEALVNGCPLIVANNTGMRDWIQDANTIVIPCSPKPAPGFGQWFEVDLEKVIQALNYFVLNTKRGVTPFVGQAKLARERILNRYTLENSAIQIRKVVEQWQK